MSEGLAPILLQEQAGGDGAAAGGADADGAAAAAAPATEYIAIGAQWCGYSRKQQETLDNLFTTDDDSSVRMIMCEGDDSLSADDQKICEAAKPMIRGFPTWFEKTGEGDDLEVQPMTRQVEAPMHYSTLNDLCANTGLAARLGNRCDPIELGRQ